MSINIRTHNYDVSRNTSYGRSPIKYIIMHYTATNGATAYNEVMYFATNPAAVNASADFFVDDNEIWQYNNQLETRYSWAVGDGSSGSYGGVCWNSNQISIEMSCYQSGGQWFISDKTYNNAVELVKYLMKKYNITSDRVIRHYDVSRKFCPGVNGWIAYFGSESTWKKFKSAISNDGTSFTANTTTSSNNTTSTQTAATNNSSIKAGSVVKLSSNATYYDGKAMPSWVKGKTWIVKSVSGDRVVIDKSVDGQNSIMSAINKKYVSLATASSATKTTTQTATKFSEYKVRVTADALNIRKGAGTNYAVTGTITDKGVYTIVGEATGTGATKWLKLKSGVGYIASDYTKKV